MHTPSPPVPRPPAGVEIYRERKFSVRRCSRTLADGSTQTSGVVVHPGAAVILAVTAADEVVFVRNARWKLGHRLLELPAGTLEPGEDPAVCAARELEEEAGYRAGRLEPLFAAYSAPGGSTEVMHAYLATELTEVGQRLEIDEEMEVERLPGAEVRRRLIIGAFDDLKTIAALGQWLLRR